MVDIVINLTVIDRRARYRLFICIEVEPAIGSYSVIMRVLHVAIEILFRHTLHKLHRACDSATGLTFAHDDPYRGGWVTKLWGRPRRRCHAIQLEFCRDLYMNEDRLERKPRELAELRSACANLVRRLGDAASMLSKR